MDNDGQWVREVEPCNDDFATLTPEQLQAVDRALAGERAEASRSTLRLFTPAEFAGPVSQVP
jgi:hypothetical protein